MVEQPKILSECVTGQGKGAGALRTGVRNVALLAHICTLLKRASPCTNFAHKGCSMLRYINDSL